MIPDEPDSDYINANFIDVMGHILVANYINLMPSFTGIRRKELFHCSPRFVVRTIVCKENEFSLIRTSTSICFRFLENDLGTES